MSILAVKMFPVLSVFERLYGAFGTAVFGGYLPANNAVHRCLYPMQVTYSQAVAL